MISRRLFSTLIAGGVLAPNVGLAQSLTMLEAQTALVFGTEEDYFKALQAISDRNNPDMIAGLILGLRFTHAPVAPLLTVLRKLTGKASGSKWSRWGDWMLWQEAHPEIVPHKSFITFKREMFLTIDANFDDFLKPEYLTRDKMRIRLEEITWGGVKKDGIPSLDNPELVSASDAKAQYLADSDLVFGVSINGDARAYPLRIMGWHEMFNAVIGGVPVALAYCTLCGSGILFETKLKGRKKPLVFGSSGFLYRSNKLMFDRQTHSLWSQFTGKPVVGPLVGKGIELQQRPVVITNWARWKTQNPETKVTSLNTGHSRNYGSGVVYSNYFTSPGLMFPTIVDQTHFRQKDYVFGVRAFGGAKAWPLKAFRKEPLINDAIGGQELVLIGNDVTRTVRAYQRNGQTFKRSSKGAISSADNVKWAVTEDALVGENGERLPRVAGHIAYWFAWNGYLSDVSEVYGQ